MRKNIYLLLGLSTAAAALTAADLQAQTSPAYAHKVISRFSPPKDTAARITDVNNSGICVGSTYGTIRNPPYTPLERPLVLVPPGKQVKVTSPYSAKASYHGQLVAINDKGVAIGWDGWNGGPFARANECFLFDTNSRRRTVVPPIKPESSDRMQIYDINNRGELLAALWRYDIQRKATVGRLYLWSRNPSTIASAWRHLPFPDFTRSLTAGLTGAGEVYAAHDHPPDATIRPVWYYSSATNTGKQVIARGGLSGVSAGGYAKLYSLPWRNQVTTKNYLVKAGEIVATLPDEGTLGRILNGNVANDGRVLGANYLDGGSVGYWQGNHFTRFVALLPSAPFAWSWSDVRFAGDGTLVAHRQSPSQTVYVIAPTTRRVLSLQIGRSKLNTDNSRTVDRWPTNPRFTLKVIGGAPKQLYGIFLVDPTTSQVGPMIHSGTLDADGFGVISPSTKGIPKVTIHAKAFALDPKLGILSSLKQTVSFK